MTYDPEPLADHKHEYVLPSPSAGRHVFEGVCKHCAAVRLWDSTKATVPGTAEGWVNVWRTKYQAVKVMHVL